MIQNTSAIQSVSLCIYVLNAHMQNSQESFPLSYCRWLQLADAYNNQCQDRSLGCKWPHLIVYHITAQWHNKLRNTLPTADILTLHSLYCVFNMVFILLPLESQPPHNCWVESILAGTAHCFKQTSVNQMEAIKAVHSLSYFSYFLNSHMRIHA